jgi:hypothetical protein
VGALFFIVLSAGYVFLAWGLLTGRLTRLLRAPLLLIGLLFLIGSLHPRSDRRFPR